ncbi:MAG: hypothetical protein E7F47_01920 [Peptoniphilus harei]|nr:hypothetical protein [Peptoniphilus harei]
MKYKEFKDKINKIANDYNLNLEVTRDMNNIYVKVGDSLCATVSTVKQFFMSIDPGALYFNVEARREIFEALYELSKTPIGERQDVKKYYLKHRFLEDGSRSYLNSDYRFQELYLNGSDQFKEIQTQFTQEEIDEIKEKYKTTLDDFEQIEVEEDIIGVEE